MAIKILFGYLFLVLLFGLVSPSIIFLILLLFRGKQLVTPNRE